MTTRSSSSGFYYLNDPSWKPIAEFGAFSSGFSDHYVGGRNVAKSAFLMTFHAVNVSSAFNELKRVIEAFCCKNSAYALALETAKKRLILDWTYYAHPHNVARQRLLNNFDGRSANYTNELLEDIMHVNIGDMARVLKQRMRPFIDNHGGGEILVEAHPSRINETLQDFQQMGINVEILQHDQLS